jgi:hypothetical protein
LAEGDVRDAEEPDVAEEANDMAGGSGRQNPRSIFRLIPCNTT